MALITKGELEIFVKSMQKDKIPGPNQWIVEFYYGFFEFIGDDLLQVAEDSRQRGHIHNPFNTTFLALIPKFDDPQSFEEYQPLCLYNCIYKITSKIITLRIKPILSRMISKEQFSFLRHCHI